MPARVDEHRDISHRIQVPGRSRRRRPPRHGHRPWTRVQASPSVPRSRSPPSRRTLLLFE